MINNISKIAQTVHKINNPNLPIGTLIEEIPTDIGRARAGYKRGGIIEGAEKFRKEIFAALVWMFGIPLFKKLGDNICEHFLSIPMAIDFCKEGEGNNSIKDSVNFIKTHTKETAGDCELAKYLIPKFKNQDAEALIKKITAGKKVTAVAAFLINCAAMGVILPKINQAITRKKLKEAKAKNFAPKFSSFEEYRNKTRDEKNNSDINFKGIGKLGEFVYRMENDNVTRLVSTDVPMIIGRTLTSRNKYEALENFFMDTTSSYLYSFCAMHVQKLLRNKTKNPNTAPIIAEKMMQNPNALKHALDNLDEIMSAEKPTGSEILYTLFDDKNLAKDIYENATYGRYGKINKFVKYKELDDIDSSVLALLKKIKENAQNKNLIKEDGTINLENIKEYVKKINNKNIMFLFLGLGVSIFGLAYLVPKLTFAITKKLTGKNEFVGIQNYDDKDKK